MKTLIITFFFLNKIFFFFSFIDVKFLKFFLISEVIKIKFFKNL